MQQINIGVERLEATLAEFIKQKIGGHHFIFSQFDTKQQNCEIKYRYFCKLKNFQ